MRYLSLFSGIGGFELGIMDAWKHTQHPGAWRNLECVGFSEIDKYASSIYQKHFPKHDNLGDITKVSAESIPDFDLLVGGFPCQAFSLAGKRMGFSDTRGTLFFDIARILEAKRPKMLLLENVRGLTNHGGGRTFSTIIRTLDELGYDIQWQILNSKYHGVPQNRERVFIVGHLRGSPRPQVFPYREGYGDVIQRNKEGQNAATLTVQYEKGGRGTHIAHAATLDTKGGMNARGTTILVREATKKGYAEARVGDSINLSIPNSKTRRGRVGRGVAQTLDTGMQQYTLTEDMKVRRLTPLECERLQGFPDFWTYGISDSQRYKCLGNAVTRNVVRDVATKIFQSITP